MKVKTIKDLVYSAAEKYGEEIFLAENIKGSIKKTDFKSFRTACDSVAVWIQEKCGIGVHAAIIGSTSSEYLTAWFGIQCSSNVTVPLDTANSTEKLADEINRSDSVMVFFDRSHREEIHKFKELCPKVKYYICLNDKNEASFFLGDILTEYSGQIPDGNPEEKDLAAILFTSGTTGKSKGVMLSNANLIDNTTCDPSENDHGQKRLTVLPVHHIFCFTCDILCSLCYGRMLCINDSLMRISKNMKLFNPHSVTFVPMIAASLLGKMQSLVKKGMDKTAAVKEVFGENLEVIFSGGAYLNPEIIHGYKEFGIDIAQGYGMTECSPRICTGKRNSTAPESSVGDIVAGCEVKIVDGEVWAKSPSVMMGYYKDPEETAKSLTPDGWLKTGDLGYKDDSGHLYLTGRKKNLIILSNGENVSPEELENQFTCFEPVKEIVIRAVNEKITAEIYPNPDYICDDIRAELQKKIDEVNESFPPAKRITDLIVRDSEFPKTSSKKIVRSLV